MTFTILFCAALLLVVSLEVKRYIRQRRLRLAWREATKPTHSPGSLQSKVDALRDMGDEAADVFPIRHTSGGWRS